MCPSTCTVSEEKQLLKLADLKLFMAIGQERIYSVLHAGFEVVSNIDIYIFFYFVLKDKNFPNTVVWMRALF